MYMMYQLKRAGINQNDLIKIDVSVVRHNKFHGVFTYIKMLKKTPEEKNINILETYMNNCKNKISI